MKNKKVRHLLGISGGKDSAALAIYMKDKYPSLDIEYYTCDTGKELDETYALIEKLESYLGKSIIKLKSTEDPKRDPFDHHYEIFGNYLPSSNARWCTKKLKLEPFENFVGDDLVVSYVGIRGDEDREGYISSRSNIQSIFPFRKNIWSEDVTIKLLKNDNILDLVTYAEDAPDRFIEIIQKPVSTKFTLAQKVNELLECSILGFNNLVFNFITSETNYPLSVIDDFPLINNEDVLVRSDIFNLLEESGVGIPEYYKKIEFDIQGQKGSYARSRSGCYFCFYQQKIEWVWLLEQHPDLFEKAKNYENTKEGFTWNSNESLEELSQPERILTIKKEFINKKGAVNKSQFLIDILEDAEGGGCAACFI